MKKENLSQVVQVYGNIEAHRSIADLIRKRSTNKRDIRDVALEQIHLESALDILDLGCGFGFFTEALNGKIPDSASLTGVDLIPGHASHYLHACTQTGVQCRFIHGDVSIITGFLDGIYDLVLCSYALYFFPEMIPHIARILKPTGVFVTITHDSQNMSELFECIKAIMQKHYNKRDHLLPAERIIQNFSAENGATLLSRWFGHVKTIDYPNALVYQIDETSEITDYFYFKSPFFLAGTHIDGNDIAVHLPELIKQKSLANNGVVISKNDRIFICSEPRLSEARP
jgi:ubiquinone/menaquinone biosynthesis C-methylase UbiE